MRCESALIRLDELRAGELPADEANEVREHLATCRECDDDRAAFDALATKLPALVRACPTSCVDTVRELCAHGYDVVEVGARAVMVAFSSRGITRVSPVTVTETKFRDEYRQRFGRELESRELPATLRGEVEAALRGERLKRADVDIDELPEFERKVLLKLLEIPPGEVRSYAWVARETGSPAAVRAVGNACARNPVPFVVPCHRVVPSSGGVGNYGFGERMKRELLAGEGVDLETIESMAKRGFRYVASRTTGIYCFPTCRDAKRIRDENRLLVRDERDATAKGLRPCQHCRPLARSA
ncbi:MAG: methylated-DNA--[protein]-cysteine S-methyltransferase [Acidobacteria bacterium]|nr:methylated-DNA--[protein]-cysteine S-methyltransferase [Acidobacteriota bacterium]